MILKTKLLLFFLIFSVYTFGQDRIGSKRFQHLTDKDGLSQQYVRAITQDNDGYIWIATEDGLNRYDGYTVEVFSHDRNNSNSIPDNFIYSLLVDKANQLWIGTNSGGLTRYNLKDDSFTHFTHDESIPNSISANRIYSIHQDITGNIWAGTLEGGLNKFDPESNSFINFVNDPNDENSIQNNTIVNITSDDSGNLWILTEVGLSFYEVSSSQFQNFPLKGGEKILDSNYPFSLVMDGSTSLWFCSDEGLTNFSISSKTFRTISYQELTQNWADDTQVLFRSLIIDADNQLWLGTTNGLIKYNDNNGQSERFINDNSDTESLNNNDIFSLFLDRSNVIWIGTAGNGINTSSLRSKNFEHFYNHGKGGSSINGNTIRALYGDEAGYLWIAPFEKGLNLLNLRTNWVSNIEQVPTNDIRAITKSKSGHYWIGTWGEGVIKSSNRNLTDFIQYRHNEEDEESLWDDRIQCIFEDSKGYIWVGTELGLDVMDPRTGKFRHFMHSEDPNSMNQYGVQSNGILEDVDGNLWVGTWGGLTRLTPDSDDRMNANYTFTRFNQQEDGSGLSDNRVISMHYSMATPGYIYLGTYGGGFNVVNIALEEVSIESFTSKDGLANNVVFGITSDDDNNIWLSTNKGLSRFEFPTRTFKNYDYNDGLQGDQFFWGAVAKTFDGELAFGGTNGISIFNPGNITDDPYEPNVILTSFKLFNRELNVGDTSSGFILQTAINEISKLDFNYKQNTFAFEFSADHFAFPENNRFQYQLEGFDESWVEVDSRQRFATYTNLNPGEYIFKVKAANFDGLWSSKEKAISIVITPPFWQTIWFYLFMIISISGTVFYVVRNRAQKVIRDKNELKNKIEEAVSEVETQKNELLEEREKTRVSNWLNSGFAEMADVMKKDKNDIHLFLHNVLKNLLRYVKADMGAVFLYEQKENVLKGYAGFAYGDGLDQVLNIEIEPGEGMLGTAFNERETQLITKVPDDYLSIKSGLGETKPESVLIVPLKFDEVIIGVMELAALKRFEEHEIHFIENVSENITSMINNVRNTSDIHTLLKEAEAQKVQLQENEEELKQNLEELRATQEHAESKIRELEDKLKGYESTESVTPDE